MKIFLEVFVDINFGDAFFIYTLTKRYAKCDFYMMMKESYKDAYLNLQKNEKNLYLFDETEEDVYMQKMDGMIVVGGDVFWDYGDYTGILRRMSTVKQKEGYLAIMGISLFEKYSEVTKSDFRQMFSMADQIVVRDKQSYIQIKQIMPAAKVIASADMAFAFDVSNVKKQWSEKKTLGISVRKKIPRNGEDRYETYCQSVAKVAVTYLEKSKHNQVKFLAFSSGKFDDREAATKIIELCPETYRHRMEIVPFLGDVEGYLAEIQRCEKLLCTRFHALAFAIILQKPFVPIVYEEKMKRLLSEIAYYGLEPNYEDELNAEQILTSFQKRYYSESEAQWYIQKAGVFFQQTDRLLLHKSNPEVTLKRRRKQEKLLNNLKKVLRKAKKILQKI